MNIFEDIHASASLLTKLLKSYNFGQEKSMHSKGANDYVTNLDLELQELILKQLPNIVDVPILSEELDYDGCNSIDSFWVIDPLDGTSNYITGLSHIATSIALVEKGRVVFGYIYDYSGGNSYYAGFGLGAFKNGILLKISNNRQLRPNLVGASSGFIKEWKISGHVETFSLSNFRILGSQALQLCFVAEGKLVGNLSVEAKIWDDAAGLLMVREAGGEYYSDTLMKIGVFGCMNEALNLYSFANGTMGEKQKFQALMENIKCKK